MGGEGQLPLTDNETAGGDIPTVEREGGRTGQAPEGASGAPPAVCHATLRMPAHPRTPARTPGYLKPKIPAAAMLPSLMEEAARSWHREATPAAIAAEIAAGKLWCRPCGAFVPDWFGKDCIAGECPLRGKS